MSAYTLFKEAGVSARLYRAFLEPMLLVTLFAPPTELSAAAALGASSRLRAARSELGQGIRCLAASSHAGWGVALVQAAASSRLFMPCCVQYALLRLSAPPPPAAQRHIPSTPPARP
jgi:hypothetical protein